MLDIRNSELMRNFQTEQRPKFKITAKVFLSHWRSTVIKECVNKGIVHSRGITLTAGATMKSTL